ncbi:hemolysin III family protein [Caulobacter sp. 17J80-11]|uniref:PAQR family membrane homeostasis protein TrhA n=1 Tax=Caulobacter sp. 17J80-11 TaxID=2763502 RepID=UPI001653B263|nr:hemolysin III family protein [Caulobacter sp. 17J80-11]MBC6980332.1 hemolysin III family protein [Caulobacter sp. 17J80-11]
MRHRISVPDFARLLAADASELVEHYANEAEKLADGWVHGIGLAAAAVGGLVLFGLSLVRGDIGLVIATAVYAVCLIAMLAFSALYNLTRPSPARRVLRRLDEAAIFLMIAGSYTPFTAVRFEGGWEAGMIAAVWGVALSGVAAKLLAPGVPDKIWCALYLGFGWLAGAALYPTLAHVPVRALLLLAAGGALYTLGVVFFLSPALPFRRAIWHGFVVTAAALHFAAVATGVVLA